MLFTGLAATREEALSALQEKVVQVVGIYGAFRSKWRCILISACIVGMMIAALLFGLALFPSNGLNIGGNTSSPPSIAVLRSP